MPSDFTIAWLSMFPNSPLAAEALYRAADILWQIEKADVSSRAFG